MRKALLLILLMFLGVFLFAQEDDYDDDEDSSDSAPTLETDWDGYMSELYSRGDQTFTISLGVIFPTVFFNNTTIIDHHINPPVGGAGTLAYTHFLNAHYFLGVEIGINIFYTLGQNSVFIIPIGLRTGWQFILHRFEFPLTFTIGVSPERYLNNGYVGLFLKGGGSAFFRFSPEWSFGLNADWSWYPQWPKENGKPVPAKNMYANVLGLTLAARYHF